MKVLGLLIAMFVLTRPEAAVAQQIARQDLIGTWEGKLQYVLGGDPTVQVSGNTKLVLRPDSTWRREYAAVVQAGKCPPNAPGTPSSCRKNVTGKASGRWTLIGDSLRLGTGRTVRVTLYNKDDLSFKDPAHLRSSHGSDTTFAGPLLFEIDVPSKDGLMPSEGGPRRMRVWAMEPYKRAPVATP